MKGAGKDIVKIAFQFCKCISNLHLVILCWSKCSGEKPEDSGDPGVWSPWALSCFIQLVIQIQTWCEPCLCLVSPCLVSWWELSDIMWQWQISKVVECEPRNPAKNIQWPWIWGSGCRWVRYLSRWLILQNCKRTRWLKVNCKHMQITTKEKCRYYWIQRQISFSHWLFLQFLWQQPDLFL